MTSSGPPDRAARGSVTAARIVGYPAPRPVTVRGAKARVLAFIDQIVIPFLTQLYGAVGYLGVLVAMAIESAMIPLPSELILPFAGFLVSDATAIEPITKSPWSFWIVVLVATLGNTIGSLIAYGIGAWGGRPFLERWGKYLLIRPHEIEIAEHFFAKYGAATIFISRLLPVVRTFISFPAGVARMPLGTFVIFSTAGAFFWSLLLTFAGVQLGSRWEDIRHALQPFDTVILVVVVVAVVLFIWWRLGRPGWRRAT
jgi:membrane protein DedA with SNARE-associated domain